jgi:hypothetical protein
VVVCYTSAHFLFFSPEAERIPGIGAMHADFAAWSVAYGCYRPDMVTPYPPEELPLARAARGEEALHELIYIRNARRPAGLWIDASAAPLRDGSGKVFGGVVVAIHSRGLSSIVRSRVTCFGPNRRSVRSRIRLGQQPTLSPC